MPDERPIIGFDEQDDQFDIPARGANRPAEGGPPAAPGPAVVAAPAPAPPSEAAAFPGLAAGATPEKVELRIDNIGLKLQVQKAQIDETAVALLYDSSLYDIDLKPEQQLTVKSGDEELQVVYAGGKVSLGQLTLLSFIRGT